MHLKEVFEPCRSPVDNFKVLGKRSSVKNKAVSEAHTYVCFIKNDAYYGKHTRLYTKSGTANQFNIAEKHYYGFAMSRPLFIIVMDVLATEAGNKPLWAMLFADYAAKQIIEAHDER